ncbi:MAG TPA: hypothetical protein VF030_08675, partial [Solirubrobacterales bacterium]
MARRSLKPQLNQIRAWVHQGRTDAWIAHQLEVSANELREFRKQYDLSPDDESAGASEIDLRDEIEAEIEAATAAEETLIEGDEAIARRLARITQKLAQASSDDAALNEIVALLAPAAI